MPAPGQPPRVVPPIVLATANPHKVEELRAIFAPAGLTILGLNDLPGGPPPEPAETGTTFEQNATIKALAYAHATGHVCLADDSGLEIDALGGRPGVISSHYSTDGVETGLTRAQRDEANNARVLRELEGVPPERRTARFVCVMALAAPVGQASQPSAPPVGRASQPAQVLTTSRGTFEGAIGLPPTVPRGTHGFGYDPLFLVAGDPGGRTSAELPPADKNRLSHRAAAARAMLAAIHTLEWVS